MRGSNTRSRWASGRERGADGRLLIAAGLAFAVGMLVQGFAERVVVARVLFALSIGCAGTLTVPKAWRALRARAIDINVLMLVAVAGAIGLGNGPRPRRSSSLFALAQALETGTLERARNSIRALMDLTPGEAAVLDGSSERRVEVDRVELGAIIVVRPGEKIPLDGEVIAGESSVNQAPVTGESLPADKAPGCEVFAGTINGRGALEIV